MKLYYYLFLVFILFSNQSHAKLEKTNIKYELRLNILGVHIKIGEINSYLVTSESDYNLKFDLETEKLINLVTTIKGSGTAKGTIKNLILYPEFYQYKYTKKKKDKNTQILFNNSNVLSTSTIPKFDISKLTPINKNMLIDVIDPITGMIYISNYELNNECTNKYKIFDGKRRYNLTYTNKFEKDGYIICRLTREKIAGFKVSNDKNDVFKPAQIIDAYYKKINDTYILEKIITKNNFSNLLIDVSYF